MTRRMTYMQNRTSHEGEHMSEPDLSYIHESLQHLAVPIADLTPDPKNARKHDRRNLDAIKASLGRFGMRSPIVVQRNGAMMIVRAGNGRMTAALELGWSHLPATVFDEEDNEAVAFAVADNRTAELAEWDFEVLVGLLEDGDIAADSLVGFEENEVKNLLDADFNLSLDKTKGESAADPNDVLDQDTLNNEGQKGRTVVFNPEQWEHVIRARDELDPDKSIVETLVHLCEGV